MSEGKPFDKSGIRYSFEKVHGEQLWQVRLKGEFLQYADHKKADLIDQQLQKAGYTSRSEVFKELIAAHFTPAEATSLANKFN